jgi:glycerophosphoryl diester phosphodiesterase
MVIHDNTSKRTCKGKNMEIETAPSIMLRELDAGIFKGEEFKGEKIPFLSEIINLIPQGKKLVVEIKCKKEVLPHLKKVIEKTGKSDQIIFICFDWKTIVETKSEFPENSCYWLSGMNTGLKKRMEQAAKIGLEGVNLKHSIIDEKVMALANDLNLEVLTWTVDDPQEAKRLIDLGVSQITTNRPKWLKSQVTENN